MSAKIKFLKDRVGNTIYPVTKTNAIYSDNGVNIENELSNLNEKVNNQLFAKYFHLEYANFHNPNLKSGRYGIYSETTLNPPKSGMLSGMVEVWATGQYIWIEYRPWNNVDIYSCNYNGDGSWTPWVKVLNSKYIINSDTINDPNKVPSSAVTYGLAQKISQWHTYHDVYNFQGIDYIDIPIPNIQITTPIFVSNADKGSNSPYVTGTAIPVMGTLRVYVSAPWAGLLRLSFFWYL
jgi:hypothetical protein